MEEDRCQLCKTFTDKIVYYGPKYDGDDNYIGYLCYTCSLEKRVSELESKVKMLLAHLSL
ncbi:Protein kinase [Orpheovirus IHUMI-LCC2]|uniref:Protein kinase n=1 Tax=Orpheovirus IHUMI-LCC2 TaxID=2023057 RepID=A0A2I2L4F4_9VIRU|nr:Protein kinase [Orpheovirus IHUMI-LCC2]SNW62435.1 Protein kinase [Orpheovirus IHUMI-LCC2]